MRKPVVIQGYPPQHPGFTDELAAEVELRTASEPDPEVLVREGRDAVALLTRGPMRYDAGVLDGLENLRWICAVGSGVDAIDLDAASARGLPVSHNPGTGPQPVVEYVLSAVIQLLRRLPQLSAAIEADAWLELRDGLVGRSAAGSTLGVVGFGHIGAAVARAARAGLGMDVLVHAPTAADDAIGAAGAHRAASLAVLLEGSDAVTLHVPLRPDTTHLIGHAELARMRPGAVLINTARGAVVDQDALLAVLGDGRLGGAAMDVFPEEPVGADHPLVGLPNVILTPHVAGVSQQALADLYLATAESLRCFLRGDRPPHLANPEVWETSTTARGGVMGDALR